VAPVIVWLPIDMSRDLYSGMSKDRLRRLLGLFFVALTIPSAILAWQAYSRLQWESFHQYQLLAEELLGGIDRRVREMIVREESRAFTDYRFLVIEGAPAANYLQRSPLSSFPVSRDIPGLLGYFQIDADGRFTTPLLPDDPRVSALAYGITDAELEQRQALRELLLMILSQEERMATVTPDGGLEKHDLQGADADSVRMRQPGADATAAIVSSRALDPRDDSGFTADEESVALPVPGRISPVMSAVSGPGTDTGLKEQKLAQAAFDRLSEDSTRQRSARSKKQTAPVGDIGRVDELELDQAFKAGQEPVQARRPLPRFKERVEFGAARREQGAAPSAAEPVPYPGEVEPGGQAAGASAPLVRMFESEVDPFQFNLLGNRHFVLYRKVWREGQRHIQGVVIQKTAFLQDLIETSYRHTALAAMSRLGIVFDGEILSALGGQRAGDYLSSTEELSGTLLYRGRLSTPLDQMELLFSITSMPAGSAGGLVIWVALVLGLVLSAGLALIYRLGVKQIELNHQQRDFVSAVSHELKTPLTSIRMYSEMLREDWADEQHKRGYYDFIHDESERLSRLISNVLQLARMSRGDLKVVPRPVAVTQLIDLIRSKVATQISQAGFEWKLDCAEAVADQTLTIDDDAFVQILINLVDNATKFSARADEKLIEVGCRDLGDGRVEFVVRDYGPGVAKDQMKKIFTLFYRSENELTRETVGTGIGLALVHRLAAAMGGEVDVVNRDPGAEFCVRFPVVKLK
jgi:signal transduction histidine kinase